ncbi:hypothetical protein NEFER03_1240 [Nematocida sp. LUAm3]|nr:hypothetical protein NEFER03_1240 [Nematocida sp. LUAm3]KAI5175849.1 hypothetical protein NEFER02_1718 [Nematocida sp. LUAm2]KAI5178345.1 hypothetical protein NEFER01_1512 [Nematocida sp. LUAm1]
MEKYSIFNDALTGINPYTRETKKRYGILRMLMPNTIIMFFFYLFPGALRMLGKSSCFMGKRAKDVQKKLLEGKRTFFCTYTCLFDSLALYTLDPNIKMFLLTSTGIYSIDQFNMQRRASLIDLSKSQSSKHSVVLFLSGGVTNGKILLNVREAAKKYEISGYIGIKYQPDTSYDINILDRWIYPVFSSRIVSIIYHVLFYSTLEKPLETSFFFSESLSGLGKEMHLEIAPEMNMKTTEKFLRISYKK